MQNPKDRHLDKKQQDKRRKSPTSEAIREGLKNKYPLGYKKKKD